MIRYMPSRKGWIITDIRKAFRRQPAESPRYFWVGHARLQRTYPSEDAAVMMALHLL